MPAKTVVAVSVLAVALGLLSLVGPWWVYSLTASTPLGSVSAYSEFRPFGRTTTIVTSGGSNATSSDYTLAPRTAAAFLGGIVAAVLGLAIGGIVAWLARRSDSMPRYRRPAALLGLLAFAFMLASPVYVMAFLPGAVTQDANASLPAGMPAQSAPGFWGSNSSSGVGSSSATWGAGWGWYIALVAALLFLVCGTLLLRARAPSRTPGEASA